MQVHDLLWFAIGHLPSCLVSYMESYDVDLPCLNTCKLMSLCCQPCWNMLGQGLLEDQQHVGLKIACCSIVSGNDALCVTLVWRPIPASWWSFAQLPARLPAPFQLCKLVYIVSDTCDFILVGLVLEVHRRKALQCFFNFVNKISHGFTLKSFLFKLNKKVYDHFVVFATVCHCRLCEQVHTWKMWPSSTALAASSSVEYNPNETWRSSTLR